MMWVWPVSIVFLQGWMRSRMQLRVAVAGMEGALASVLGGLVNKPVIAVPTSVGYGASNEWNIRAAHDDQFLRQRGLLR